MFKGNNHFMGILATKIVYVKRQQYFNWYIGNNSSFKRQQRQLYPCITDILLMQGLIAKTCPENLIAVHEVKIILKFQKHFIAVHEETFLSMKYDP